MAKASRKGRGAGARSFAKLAGDLAEVGRSFHARGWVLGTGGNVSAVLRRKPLRLAISPSGADKGFLAPEAFLEIDDRVQVWRGSGKPSAEALLHLAVVRARGAGAVLHTHSVWSTILSEAFASQGGLSITGFEMLKGLDGVTTHEHQEWLPLLENWQDIPTLARELAATLARHPQAHGFLLRRHWLYTWGKDLPEARRHVEVLEFLLEVLARTHGTRSYPGAGS